MKHSRPQETNLLKTDELPRNPEKSEELMSRETAFPVTRTVEDVPDRNDEIRKRLENISRRRSVVASLNTEIPLPPAVLTQQRPAKPSPPKVVRTQEQPVPGRRLSDAFRRGLREERLTLN